MLTVELKMTQEILARAYAAKDSSTLRMELHRTRGGISYLTLPQIDPH